MVTGALALLENTGRCWRARHATALLFQTATDLGAKGVDSSYGNGLLNLSQAFQPVGTLSVTGTNGKTMAVSSLSASLLSGGASLARLAERASLELHRLRRLSANFLVNLASLISQRTSTAPQSPPPARHRRSSPARRILPAAARSPSRMSTAMR